MVDANNVRGKEDFKMTNRDLLLTLKAWRDSSYPNINIVCAIDHGSVPAIIPYEGLGLIEFAGPNRTADDVIAQSARWFSNASISETYKYEEENLNCDTFIITSDGGLKLRCLSANRPGNFKRKRKVKENVKVFASPQLLASFKKITTVDDPTESSNKFQSMLEAKISEVENDLRLYERQRPPWPSRQAKLNAMALGPWKSTILVHDKELESKTSTEVLKTSFSEKTWHRILVAENMRRMLGQCASSSVELSDLLQRYQSLHETSLKKLDMTQSTMVYDRRIRYETVLQKELIEYMELGMASVTSDSVNLGSNKSPVEAAADLLKQMVLESSHKTQDQILLRYMSEAPQWMQFPTKHDLRELLQFIAIRERRDGDNRKVWYLVPNHSTLDCWYVQPGRSRRRRRTEKQLKYDLKVDPTLLAEGERAETQWFGMLKWPRQEVLKP
jgi:hypothetical protein